MISFAAVNAADWTQFADRNPKDFDKIMSCGVGAVDVRIALPFRGPSQAEIKLAKLAADAGLEVRAHGWAGKSDGTSAEASIADHAAGLTQGKKAAENAAILGARRYGCNAEHHVWRGQRPGCANPKAVDFLAGFLDGFYPENRAAFCDYVGFPDPAFHYKPADLDGDGDLDTEIPEDEQIRWGRCAVMAYQTDPATVLKTINRAAKNWSALDVEPWVGVGRIDVKDGQVGSEAATKAAYKQCGRITLYVGFKAFPQVLVGHAGHRALVSLTPILLGTKSEVMA